MMQMACRWRASQPPLAFIKGSASEGCARLPTPGYPRRDAGIGARAPPKSRGRAWRLPVVSETLRHPGVWLSVVETAACPGKSNFGRQSVEVEKACRQPNLTWTQTDLSSVSETRTIYQFLPRGGTTFIYRSISGRWDRLSPGGFSCSVRRIIKLCSSNLVIFFLTFHCDAFGVIKKS